MKEEGEGETEGEKLKTKILRRGAASAQQGDLRLLGPLSGHRACAGARTCDRRVPANLFLTPSSRRPTGVPNLLQKGLFGFMKGLLKPLRHGHPPSSNYTNTKVCL
ncbi:hypothetical protein PoB_001235800 [Plakobranchus ocellatus]|uniref:Uncharacterized protein n=1 Tax=Plakobranchus ocellatus TaxID=259542 RepID=A0AAV3YUD3_9GAST|nr:hypothetical protein PoB_001235800 [Plakobranchus ocellatus]